MCRAAFLSFVPAQDPYQPLAGVVIGAGGKIAVVAGIGAHQIIQRVACLILDRICDHRGVVQPVVTENQNVAHIAGIVAGLRQTDQTVAGVGLGVVHKIAHIDPGIVLVFVAVPIPTGVACFIHGNTPGQQHLGAEVLAVAACIIVGVPVIAAPLDPGLHVGIGCMPVIVVIPVQMGDIICFALLRLSQGNVSQKLRQTLVAAPLLVIYKVIIGVVVRVVFFYLPGAVLTACQCEGVNGAELLALHIRGSHKVDEYVLGDGQIQTVTVLPAVTERKRKVVGQHPQINKGRFADLDEGVPDGLVPVGLLLRGEQITAVLYFQSAYGLIVAVQQRRGRRFCTAVELPESDSISCASTTGKAHILRGACVFIAILGILLLLRVAFSAAEKQQTQGKQPYPSFLHRLSFFPINTN